MGEKTQMQPNQCSETVRSQQDVCQPGEYDDYKSDDDDESES